MSKDDIEEPSLDGLCEDEVRLCALPECRQPFTVNPRAPHQKYHCSACGDAARADWKKPPRKAYMQAYWKEYVKGYVRPRYKTSTG